MLLIMGEWENNHLVDYSPRMLRLHLILVYRVVEIVLFYLLV